MLLIAIKPHGYAGRPILAGQEYDARREHAIALVGARVSRFAPVKTERRAAERPATYETKAEAVEEVSQKKPFRKKRQYKRRDVNPKD